MDVVDWKTHVVADKKHDKLSQCGSYWGDKIMDLWMESRKKQITTAADANIAIRKLVSDILCNALVVVDLDRASGGANKYYSADSSWVSSSFGKSEHSHGVASEEDAQRIMKKWNAELRAYRETLQNDPKKLRLVPEGIFMPPRNVDICLQPELANIQDKDVTAVLQHRVKSPYVVGINELVLPDANQRGNVFPD